VESDIVVMWLDGGVSSERSRRGLRSQAEGGLGGVEVPGRRRHGGEHLLEGVVVGGGDWWGSKW
jgi:hypothetical protein